MRDLVVESVEELLHDRLDDRALVVLAREPLHCIEGCPGRHHDHLGAVVAGPDEHARLEEPVDVAKLRQDVVGKVLVAVACDAVGSSFAAPDAYDAWITHRVEPTP